MRAVLQRVRYASVEVEGQIIGRVGDKRRESACGLLIFVGVSPEDTQEDAAYVAQKCMDLRIFEDGDGKMNLSVKDLKGEVLVVSQFTLYGDCQKGRRPSFSKAAKPPFAEEMYETFVRECEKSGLRVETGNFGADMQVEIHNDGPVTLIVESKNRD
jgi:D-tyrosyl-tRNA(Tyr) deacylase